jgi:hypothetical protein
LAEAIAKMLDNNEIRREAGVRGQKKALDYEGAAPWRRIVEELERVVAAGKSPNLH